jgi:hypothetical protein
MTAVSSDHVDPARIMQLGEGFMASKTLLSAIELELFTHLASTALTGSQIRDRLGLHPRAVPDFPDALLALGMLTRDGDGPDARYANTRRRQHSSTRPARPISAVCWRCATPGCTGSGETSPRR